MTPGAEDLSCTAGGSRVHPRWSTHYLIALPLMCISFAVAWSVGFQLLDTRGIGQLDVWFEADTDDLLSREELSDLVRHPNLGLFVRRPVALVARGLAAIGVGAGSPVQLYHWLVLMVAPVAGAARTLAAYQSLFWLTRSLPLAILLSLLDIAGFGTIALGSVPESYPLTGACLAGLYWLLAADARRNQLRWSYWIAAGTVAVGVTLTNVMSFAIILGTSLLARGVQARRIVWQVGAAVLAVLTLTVGLVLASAVVIDEPIAERFEESTGKFLRTTTTGRVAQEVAWAMAHTFVAPLAKEAPGRYTHLVNPDHGYVLLLPESPLRELPQWWRALVPVVALLLGAAGHLYRRGGAIWLVPAVVIVAGNFVLHLFFGHVYFLYAMHWAYSMVWIMAGVAFLPGRARLAGKAVVVLLVVMTAGTSAFLVRQLISQLQAA